MDENNQNIPHFFFALDRTPREKQDRHIMNREDNNATTGRSKRWEEGLIRQALERGGSQAVAQRAASLVREMNIVPWVALAVAERLVSLQQARLLDAAARCKELPAAVLEARIPVDRLQQSMPYAPHLLAVEVMPMLQPGRWTQRELTRILEVLLQAEQRRDEAGAPLPVRLRPAQDYAETVRRMDALMTEARCGLAMALDVALGRLTDDFVRRHAAHRRRLDRESREAALWQDRRPPFPAHGGGGPRSRPSAWPRRPDSAAGGGRHRTLPPRRDARGGFSAGTPGS